MASAPVPTMLIRGVGDVGSAVAVLLFRAGYSVTLHDDPAPTTPRRGMAFADAVFDAETVLAGIAARRIDQPGALRPALLERQFVPITILPFANVLKAVSWTVLIDARLRKRSVPERQRGLAPLTVGLGPNFIAGENVDVAIETSWGERLGTIIEQGATLPLAGEPRSLAGIGRARFVYAPVGGCFESAASIGERVVQGQAIAHIGDVTLSAPLAGTIRGLTRSGVPVPAATKVIEVDPRGDASAAFGLGERPKRIAEGVCRAIAGRATQLSNEDQA
ncbi:xanthine dehydrogenase [Bradyrhizobium viridifuturi]|uniref:xanthine dehydrogenase n=1 Tax=uncultured Bradyrhizobium sp. TaxID=199684 RepID=UPI001BAE2C86|nr:xanthine dehydrogenase [uncultured Bradyrhizobium sp.]MBR1041148.1 xanthine dehydrogenase [Bradyrhizobium viridifuturi]MBR1075144.1 xanthine dehydrogenase [Bradyrhizobium viridifuturi]